MAKESREETDELTIGCPRLDMMVRMVIRGGRCDRVVSKLLRVVFAAVMNKPEHCACLGFDCDVTDFFVRLSTNLRTGEQIGELDYGLFYDLAAGIAKWYSGNVEEDSPDAKSFEKALACGTEPDVKGFATGRFQRFLDVCGRIKFAYYPSDWITAQKVDAPVHESVELGYCYLQLVRPSHRETVKTILGKNPTLFAFVAVCWPVLRPYRQLADFVFEKVADKQWHVERGGCSETMACNMYAEMFESGTVFNQALKHWETVGAGDSAKPFDEVLQRAMEMIPHEVATLKTCAFSRVQSSKVYGPRDLAMFPDGSSSLRRFFEKSSIASLIATWPTTTRYLALTMAVKEHNDYTYKLVKMHELIRFMTSLAIPNDKTDSMRRCAVSVSESITMCAVQRRFWSKHMYRLSKGFISLESFDDYHSEIGQVFYEEMFAKLLDAISASVVTAAKQGKSIDEQIKRSRSPSINGTISTTDSRLREMSSQYKHVRTKDLPGFDMSSLMWFVLPSQERFLYRRRLLRKMAHS